MLNVRIRAAALALACLLPLAGCAGTTPGTGPISSGTSTPAKIVTGVQQACGLTVSNGALSAVISVLAGTTGPAAIVDAAVKALCAAVAPLASGPGLEGVRQGYVGDVHVGIRGNRIVRLP